MSFEEKDVAFSLFSSSIVVMEEETKEEKEISFASSFSSSFVKK